VGHRYITVVYDMRRNRVVWVHKDHGKSVFEEFCQLLTPEERENIKVVAGDGARWIDDCVREHFPNAKRCVDFFHALWKRFHKTCLST
jgi:transposase